MLPIMRTTDAMACSWQPVSLNDVIIMDRMLRAD